MYVIGTAGHIDHGKSTLVRALTGIDPDRLREEKERGMTIDLGFAWLRLPSGREVSIVDVPGHERFIKNMLAGVGGIDLALLVVAADEGIMPQTEEHLAILDLLRVRRAVVALTKCDLVEADWLDLVRDEVAERLGRSRLSGAPIVAVSAVTGEGLPALLTALDAALDAIPPKPDLGRPRLPIDRAFTIAGFGSVVTGTLIDGALHVGDEVEILPEGLRSRIRGLQMHRQKVEQAAAGSRVAVNLAGLAVDALYRGQVLTSPGWLHPTTAINARLQVLDQAPPLVHGSEVSFHAGSAEVGAHVRILDGEVVRPGEEGWVQLRFDRPVALVKGDLFIIRSPNATLGGGEVVELHARRPRRRYVGIVQRLQVMQRGVPAEMIRQVLVDQPGLTLPAIVEATGLPAQQAAAVLEELVRAGEVVRLGEIYVAAAMLAALCQQVEQELRLYHARFPLRPGMPREELKSRLGMAPRAFTLLLEYLTRDGRIVAEESVVRLMDHRVAFDGALGARVQAFLEALAADPYAPPALDDLAARFGLDDEVISALVAQGKIVRVSDTIAFTAEAFDALRRRVIEFLQEQGSASVAEVRDLLQTSRRYALALLEYFDQQHLTRRVGDMRVLR
ncbi:MAG TPA: selenocysteine-specific translation elongation factor [Chloroflexota bacterium]|nr:selenocysteine-specific translation elongation factor [Chloroflexota bacterium]